MCRNGLTPIPLVRGFCAVFAAEAQLLLAEGVVPRLFCGVVKTSFVWVHQIPLPCLSGFEGVTLYYSSVGKMKTILILTCLVALSFAVTTSPFSAKIWINEPNMINGAPSLLFCSLFFPQFCASFYVPPPPKPTFFLHLPCPHPKVAFAEPCTMPTIAKLTRSFLTTALVTPTENSSITTMVPTFSF